MTRTCLKDLRFRIGIKVRLGTIQHTQPLPGTRLYEKLSSKTASSDTDWPKYDMGNAVFMPAQMTPKNCKGHGLGLEGILFLRFYSKRLFSVNFNLLQHLLYFAPLLVLNMSFKRALDFESKMAKASITKH